MPYFLSPCASSEYPLCSGLASNFPLEVRQICFQVWQSVQNRLSELFAWDTGHSAHDGSHTRHSRSLYTVHGGERASLVERVALVLLRIDRRTRAGPTGEAC
jgi:hypothetical protein